MDIRQYKQRNAGVLTAESENGYNPSSLIYNPSHLRQGIQMQGPSNPSPQRVRDPSGVRCSSGFEGSGRGREYGSGRASTLGDGVNINVTYSPCNNNNSQVALLPQAVEVDPHDVELEKIGTYLKNYYGQDEVESQKSLFSVDADDVLALAQCFYLDFFRLVKEKRLAEGAGLNGEQSTFLTTQATPQHVGVPIHRDDVMRSPSMQRSLSPGVVGQFTLPVQIIPSISSSQITPVQQYQQVQLQQQPSQQQYQQLQQQLQPPQQQYQTVQLPQYQPVEPQPPQQQYQQLQLPQYQPVEPQPPQQQYQQLQLPQYQPVEPQPPQQQYQQVQLQQHHISSLLPPAKGHAAATKRHTTSRSPVLPKTRVTMKQLMITGPSSNNNLPIPPKPAATISSPRRVSGERYIAPISLKVAMSKMERGSYVIKYARNGGKPQKRFLFITDITISIGSGIRQRNVPVPHLCWCESPDSMGNPSGRLCLLHLLDVRYGVHDKFPKISNGLIKGLIDEGCPTIEEKMCFTFVFESRSVDLAAMSESVFQLWVGGMTSVLKKNAELS